MYNFAKLHVVNKCKVVMLKKIVFLFLIGLSLDAKIKHLEQSASYIVPEEGSELLDKIEYVLYGPDETVVLTSSEINRLSIDGRALSFINR